MPEGVEVISLSDTSVVVECPPRAVSHLASRQSPVRVLDDGTYLCIRTLVSESKETAQLLFVTDTTLKITRSVTVCVRMAAFYGMLSPNKTSMLDEWSAEKS